MSLLIKQERLVDIRVPDQVIEPGDPMTVYVVIRNEAGFITSYDPDNCQNNPNCDPHGTTTGYCVRVVLTEPDGTVQSKYTCHNYSPISRPTKEVRFRTTVPTLPDGVTSEDFDVSARIELTGGETQVSDTLTKQITVSSEEPVEPPTNGGDGGDGDPNGGDSPSWFDTAVEHPMGTAVLGIGSVIAIREAMDFNE